MDLFSAFLLNFMDIVILYLLVNKLINQKIVLTPQRFLVGVMYGVVLGLFFYQFSGHMHQIIFTITGVLITYSITKRNFISTLSIYAIVWVLIPTIQLLLWILISVLNLPELLSQTQIFLIGQTLSIAFALFLYLKIPINKIFEFIDKHLLLQLITIILAFVSFGFLLYWNFEYPIGSLILFFAPFLLNLMDIVILYLLVNKLINRKIVLTPQRLLVGIAYGAFSAIAMHLIDPQVQRIIATIIAILITHLIIKRTFISTIFAYGITLIFIAILQTTLAVLIQLLPLSQMSVFLIVQVLTTALVSFLYFKIPINKIFEFIDKHLLLKLIILILAFVSFGFLFYWNFEYSLANVIFFLLLTGASLFGIYKLATDIYHLTIKIPRQIHDFKNSIHGAMLKAYQEEDPVQISALKAIYSAHGFGNEGTRFELGKTRENILAFIESKKEACEQEIEIVSHIDYYKDHHIVGIEVIIKMLGILLDNAIETGTNKPIIIELDVALGRIDISVSNEYENCDSNAIRNMFEEGYSTKASTGRGFGLSNLYREVKRFDGEISTKCRYHEEIGTTALTIVIEI